MNKISMNNFNTLNKQSHFKKQYRIWKSIELGSTTDLHLVTACCLVDNDPEQVLNLQQINRQYKDTHALTTIMSHTESSQVGKKYLPHH